MKSNFLREENENKFWYRKVENISVNTQDSKKRNPIEVRLDKSVSELQQVQIRNTRRIRGKEN